MSKGSIRLSSNIVINDDERIDDLMTDGLKIIQSVDVFRFGIDAVLLSKFCSVPKHGKILDLCSGNGVIPLLLSQRTKAEIKAVEIQERLAEMAIRSIRLNGLDEQIEMIHLDLKEASAYFGIGQFDLVTVNPPYLPIDWGQISENQHVAFARHEVGCTLDDVLVAASKLVTNGGKFAMVYRATRLVDAIEKMRAYRLEPKRIQFVHGRIDLEPQMVLIEGIRNGKPELRIMPPLIIQEAGEPNA